MNDLERLAKDLLQHLRRRHMRLATAESCTGGLIAATLTEIAGSSDVVERGFVTSSTDAKADLLGVPQAVLAQHGAVSEPVARAMAEGALKASPADLAIAVTGLAGPGGATPTTPVGLVQLAVAGRNIEMRHERHVFAGDRREVRRATVERAFQMIRDAAGQEPDDD